jgi:HK97 gp10 family phage protein
MGSFIPKRPDIVDKLKNDFIEADGNIDRALKAKMEAIVNVVFRTATARRPKISMAMQKSLGRNTKSYRVSDPNAAAGVPVKTGNLQMSIKKEVVKKGKEKWVGRIFVEGPGAPYAAYMEFGTSTVRARPFMRPAVHLNQDWIKRKFEEPIK